MATKADKERQALEKAANETKYGELSDHEQALYDTYFKEERAKGRPEKNIQNIYEWRSQQLGYQKAGLPSTLPSAMGALLPPDLADTLGREARTAQLLRLQMGQGRRSQFLTGPGGAPMPGFNRLRLGG